ncbi:MAG: hypothetical protein QOH63_3182 [Acidobacteriota bacterium]|jgi:hypothetical protein|nr:hypothetical protein [Acidobacteriota bacterium]
MKIFISWSGELSQAVALILRLWLKNVIQVIEPYVSSEDIEKGSRWFADIDKKLDESDFSIVCLTRENMNKPWILFEAGAISRSINRSRVTPLLIDLSPAYLNGPLAQFQATTISEIDMLRLVKDIGNFLGDSRFNDSLIERAFYKWWPDLQQAVSEVIEAAKDNEPKVEIRPDRDILEELLQTTRTLAQLLPTSLLEAEALKAPRSADSDLERIKSELEKRQRMFLVIALEGASRATIEGNELYVEFSPEAKHLRDNLAKPESVKILREVCRKVLGRDIGIRIIVNDRNVNSDQSSSLSKEEANLEKQRLRVLAEQHPGVQQLLRSFRSEITDVRLVEDEQSEDNQN